ncbi:hypothetical protein Ntsu_70740 [Nocardia sp. IFM 10818]
MHTRQIQLTDHAHRHRPQMLVQHQQFGIVRGRADRHLIGIGAGDLVRGHVDRGLGGAVQIVQRRTAHIAEGRRGGGGQRLTGGEHHAQRVRHAVARCGHEDRQHGRHEMRDGNAVLAHGAQQVRRIAMAFRLGDHQPRADLQGPEELPHRDIEGERGLLQDGIILVQPVHALPPAQIRHNGAVRDRDALGTAGGARGEDDVGDIVR